MRYEGTFLQSAATKAMLVAAMAGLTIVALPGRGWSQGENRPPRTFPLFAGTWLLDEAASTGRLNMAPPVPRTVTIATTPDAVSVTKRLELPPERPGREGKRRATDTPPPEIYRFDGTETTLWDGQRATFLLVGDALALTIRRGNPARGDNITVVTDAYSVEGDVLTLERQLSTVLMPAGHIATMKEPANNFRHVYIYRRAAER